MTGLTHKQAELLRYIEGYVAKTGGVPPSFREMADAMGIVSKSGVHRLLSKLEERGFIRTLYAKVRSLEVVPQNPLAAFSIDELLAEVSRRRGKGIAA